MMLDAQTSATRYNIETWNMILNLDGLSWSQMQLDALKICHERSPRSRRATTPSAWAR